MSEQHKQSDRPPVAPEAPGSSAAPEPGPGTPEEVAGPEPGAVLPTLRQIREDPRVPTMLVLRGFDGSEMPYPDPPGWLATVRERAEEIGRSEVADALTAEAIHAEHLREFTWMERDGVGVERCHNCQRWARYAAAVARAAAASEAGTDGTDGTG